MRRGLCGESRAQAEPALWFPYRPQGMCRGPAPLVRGRWRCLPMDGNATGQYALLEPQQPEPEGSDVNMALSGCRSRCRRLPATRVPLRRAFLRRPATIPPRLGCRQNRGFGLLVSFDGAQVVIAVCRTRQRPRQPYLIFPIRPTFIAAPARRRRDVLSRGDTGPMH
jgi:hypothetical protein